MAGDRALSVTEAMSRAKGVLEGVRVRVVGEVSELSDKPGYKAVYFSLCDSGATMPCLMWRDAYAASGLTLHCGMLVELSGGFSAYLPKGRLQFIARSMQAAGEGRLRIQVAELARRLEAEGLMRPDRKRAVPRFPQRIAVVTSPRGKAVHDVLRTLRRRYPLAEVLVAGIAVEGADAVGSIAEGIAVASEARPDVLLLVRGGGSYEDLMPFNAEQVARAIAACAVPVVTGIGHEPDTTIADMVADLRASTPTAAAEACAPSCDELETLVRKERRLLGAALQRRVQTASHRVERLVSRPMFRDAHALLGSREQHVDAMAVRLRQALPRRLEREQLRLVALRGRLQQVGGGLTVGSHAQVALAAARLEDLSPLAILSRGYAVARRADGSIVRDAQEISVGEQLAIHVARGIIDTTVTGTKEES